MSEVKRFYQSVEYKDAAHMKEHPEGEYVLYSDYENIKAQLERAEEVIKYYSKSFYVFDEEDDDTEQLYPDKPWRHVSGKKAREYFKEKGQV